MGRHHPSTSEGGTTFASSTSNKLSDLAHRLPKSDASVNTSSCSGSWGRIWDNGWSFLRLNKSRGRNSEKHSFRRRMNSACLFSNYGRPSRHHLEHSRCPKAQPVLPPSSGHNTTTFAGRMTPSLVEVKPENAKSPRIAPVTREVIIGHSICGGYCRMISVMVDRLCHSTLALLLSAPQTWR